MQKALKALKHLTNRWGAIPITAIMYTKVKAILDSQGFRDASEALLKHGVAPHGEQTDQKCRQSSERLCEDLFQTDALRPGDSLERRRW